MRGVASFLSRSGLALTTALLLLSLLRWGPFYARPPLDVRALVLAPVVLVLGIVAALTGRRRPPVRSGPLALGVVGAALALACLFAVRPAGGLGAILEGPQGILGRLPPGPIDVVADDLSELPRTHRAKISWSGTLRPPRSGFYRLWAGGEGWVSVRVDGESLWEKANLPAGCDTFLKDGAHLIEVEHGWSGPPVHFRLGWREPHGDGRPGGRDEMIPPRALGPPLPGWVWIGTDLLSLLLAGLVGFFVFRLPFDVSRRPRAPGSVSGREVVVVLIGLLLVVAAMSYPLALHPVETGPVDRADGRLNAWILAWGGHALFTNPLRVFEAPIFHPLPDALAFSENLLLPAFVVAPLEKLGGPVLGYNAALFLSLALSGLGTHLLIRRVSGDRFAAFVGAAFFAAGAHRWFRLAHLHAQMTVFLPLALWSLDRFWGTRSLGRALAVGGCLLLQGLSSVYLGVITATTLALAFALAIVGGLRGRALLYLSVALALGGLLLFPVVRPYVRMRAFEGRQWSLVEVRSFATTPESYLASATRLWGPLTERHADEGRTREPLFPGLVPLALGVAGLAVAPRRYRAVAILATLLAFVLSLGPETPLYRFLYAHVLFFRGVRALNRFSLVPALALSVLSGLALAGRGWGRALALALGLLEATNVPLAYGRYSPPTEASRWLSGKEGAVLYFPLGERDTEVMLQGLAHLRPLLNGDSGFVPVSYDREMELLEGGVSDEGLRLLRAFGVRHVVARRDLPLPLSASFGEERIYSIPEGERARSVSRGTLAPSLWGTPSPTLDLGAPKPIDGVIFEVGRGSWVDRPRLEISEDGRTWEEVRGRASLADAIVSLTEDPRHARGAIDFPRRTARFVRLDPGVPAVPGLLWASP